MESPQVAVVRYAPHLDKCMGKNKGNRITASRTKSTSSSSSSIPHPGTVSRQNSNTSINGDTSDGRGNGNTKASALAHKSKGGRPLGRRTNRNLHPDLAKYQFPPDSFVVRLAFENGCKCLD
jgi:hypothetical protein